MRDQMTAVVLDELDGGRPAGRERLDAMLALVELHCLHIRRYLSFTDHADHGASSAWLWSELQRPGRRGDEEGCCAHGCGRVQDALPCTAAVCFALASLQPAQCAWCSCYGFSALETESCAVISKNAQRREYFLG